MDRPSRTRSRSPDRRDQNTRRNAKKGFSWKGGKDMMRQSHGVQRGSYSKEVDQESKNTGKDTYRVRPETRDHLSTDDKPKLIDDKSSTDLSSHDQLTSRKTSEHEIMKDSNNIHPSRQPGRREKSTLPAKSSSQAVGNYIVVKVNDRLGTSAMVPCLPSDTVGDFKKLVAMKIGRPPHQIMLKRQSQRPFKDSLTMADYEVGNGAQLDLELDTGD